MTVLTLIGFLTIAWCFGYIVGHVQGMQFVNRELALRKAQEQDEDEGRKSKAA